MSRTSKDVCQVIMIKIRDTYGFKSVLVFQVRDPESGNPLWFYCPKLFVLRTIHELCQQARLYPLTWYPAFSRWSTVCDPV